MRAGRPTVTCAICGHEWSPYGDGQPKLCHGCKSPQWRGRLPHGNIKPNVSFITGDVAEIDISTQTLQGAAARIDAADLALILDGDGRWLAVKAKKCAMTYASRKRRSDGRSEFMHRRILGLSSDDGFVVDHANRDGLDNRRANLRKCSQSENMANQAPVRGGSSTWKGVTRTHGCRPWVAHIKLRGRHIHLGRYQSEVEAARAYNVAARELFGEFARINITDEVSA